MKSYIPEVFTISIGNMTTGGTGKTPTVMAFAEYFSRRNFNVCILSRGYGRKSDKSSICVVKADNKILTSGPEECGDEPYLIANSLDNVTVLSGANRSLSAAKAINNYNAEILILDDGFQHLKVARDLNVLLIDVENGLGNSKLLPAGPLREGRKAYKRADCIILVNKGVKNPDIPSIYQQTKGFKGPVSPAHYNLTGFKDLQTGGINETIPYKKVLTFSGIAHPTSFIRQVEENHLELVANIDFVDHQSYSSDDISRILETAKNSGAEAIITTEKDEMKLLKYIDKINIPLYSLKMRMEVNIAEIIGKLGLNEKITRKT